MNIFGPKNYVPFLPSYQEIIIPFLISIFLANVSILYPLKTSENHRFSHVSWEHRIGTLVENGLNILFLFMFITHNSHSYHFLKNFSCILKVRKHGHSLIFAKLLKIKSN